MCGIFAYLNYLTPRSRQEIIDILIKGLQRLEYRGYDSSGIAIDGDYFENVNGHSTPKELVSPSLEHPILLLKRSGKVKALEEEILKFVVVHNGIITNYKDLKEYLQRKGFEFESDTDTEVIAKMVKYIHDRYPRLGFREIVELAIHQLNMKRKTRKRKNDLI